MQTLQAKLLVAGEIQLLHLRINCKQLDGTYKLFKVYPEGEQPKAVPGSDSLIFATQNIMVQSLSSRPLLGFIKLIDDTEKELITEDFQLEPGEYYIWPPIGQVVLPMPNRDYILTAIIGHYE